ncbi:MULTISPECIES: DUF4352 domain-containing protein [unclassified Streptomyces]|uniref:DUF4352 domain-containing protein n=1 Tax=unclassified Streptomyces TaxID=2593676 RepID=UPI0004BDFB6E|nr:MULTISPECIES: DUF4352 domain-containing protein [unclassified Streptomyces]
MSTPPNPPRTPVGPPTEPAGTPIPETPEPSEIPGADSVPASAQPLSLEKTPAAPEAPTAAATEQAPAPSGFAPITPASPTPAATDFGAPEAPGAPGTPGGGPTPGHPGYPGHPGAPYPGHPGYPGHPQVAPAGNGLAVASLVTGGIGIVLGVIPFFFWAGTLIAAVGLGLGIGGVVRANKGAPNKSLAVVGTVLSALGLFASVGGLFLTVLVVDSADSRRDRQVEEDRRPNGRHPGSAPSPSGSVAPTQVPGLTSALPFGESFTYPNGVTVSLSAPTKYNPKNAFDRERVKNAVQITVTVTNHSTAPFEVMYVHPAVRDDRGALAEPVYGFDMPKAISGSLMPGETASGVHAFELPKGTENITADISPGIRLDKVKYAGPID